MPVFQDGENVIPVLHTLAETISRPFEIIAVYDREDDPTVSVLERLQERIPQLRVLKSKADRGCLPALLTGFSAARNEYVGIWVSYHIDPYGRINEMLKLMDEGCDLVSANRLAGRYKRPGGGMLKNVLSWFGNYLVKHLLGSPISDLSTSVKIFRKSQWSKLTTETAHPNGWVVIVEWVVKLLGRGAVMKEVEFGPSNLVLMHRESNFRLGSQFWDYLHWIWYGLQCRVSRREL